MNPRIVYSAENGEDIILRDAEYYINEAYKIKPLMMYSPEEELWLCISEIPLFKRFSDLEYQCTGDGLTPELAYKDWKEMMAIAIHRWLSKYDKA